MMSDTSSDEIDDDEDFVDYEEPRSYKNSHRKVSKKKIHPNHHRNQTQKNSNNYYQQHKNSQYEHGRRGRKKKVNEIQNQNLTIFNRQEEFLSSSNTNMNLDCMNYPQNNYIENQYYQQQQQPLQQQNFNDNFQGYNFLQNSCYRYQGFPTLQTTDSFQLPLRCPIFERRKGSHIAEYYE